MLKENLLKVKNNKLQPGCSKLETKLVRPQTLGTAITSTRKRFVAKRVPHYF